MTQQALARLLANAKQAMALLGVNIEAVANGTDLPAEITGQDDYDDIAGAVDEDTVRECWGWRQYWSAAL